MIRDRTTRRIARRVCSVVRRPAGLFAVAVAVLTLILSGCTAISDPSGDQPAPVGKDDIQLVMVIRSYSTPYESELAKGAQAYADHVGLPLKIITTDGDSQKQLSLVKAALASNKKTVMSINVNQSSDTPAIVNAVTQAGGYITTLWNKHEDVKVWDFAPNWVAHVSFDGRVDGYQTANEMMDKLGAGGVVVLQGILDNLPASQRYEGFKKALAEHPDITMLDQQVALWDRTKGYQVAQTLLTKYGDKIKGIWTADDAMTLGALTAVAEAGRNDIVVSSSSNGVHEAFEAIDAGTLYNTYASDQSYTGALGLALGFQAATGQLDVNSLTPQQRQWYAEGVVVDKNNVGSFLTPPDLPALMNELETDPHKRMAEPIV
ncbi:MAG: ABC transporter substrate-binding protein [Gordonia sp. (in: high G+C Gram-positive bacteria)]|nr:MAG: ABC transporter substrate-binding protein [Gordonia sp. (in: high G+C Gram-positive bacteria)]